MTSEEHPGSPDQLPPPGGEAVESPAGLGEILSRTFSAAKRGIWTLLGINLVGVAVNVLAAFAVPGMDHFQTQSTSNESFDQVTTWTVLQWAIILLLLLLAQAIYVKAAFVSIAGADRLLAGERPTFSEMWRDSSGSLRRSIPLWILAILVVVAFVLLFVVYDASTASLSSDTALGRAVGIFTFALLFWGLIVYFSVRWVYVGQSLTLEKASWAESLRRSWRLTSRDFWRTFGYLLVFYMMVMAVYSVAAIFGAGPGLLTGDQIGAESGSYGSAMEAFITQFVSSFETTVNQGPLGWLIMLISNMFSVVFITAMYRDQQYRISLRERGIDPKNVTPVWQGPSQHQYPAEQPTPPPSPSGQSPATPPPNLPGQSPDNSP